MKRKNLIADRTFNFAIVIIKLVNELKTNREYVLSNQLLRSGTSIGANVQEATAAQSKKDFVHKMSIASKEARETFYWLRLIEHFDLKPVGIEEAKTEIQHIINIITKIVKTASTA